MTDRTHSRLETAHSTLRVTAAALAVVMLIVSALSVPVAAQTDSDTNPCEFGPPVPGQDGETETDEDLEVVLANDRTESMNASELGAAKNGSIGLVDGLNESDEAAVVSFYEGMATLDQELTRDHQSARDAINAMALELGPDATLPAIETSHDELINGTNATQGAEKVMVLFSDDPSFNDQDIFNASQSAKDAGIRIVTIGLGDVNESDYEQVASSPDDAYFSPSDEELDGIYEEIGADLGAVSGGLRIDTRDLFKPGATHGYEVTNVTYVVNPATNETETIRTDVTDQATLTSSNTSLLSVDEANTQLIATDDANTSTWVRIDATTANATGCTNVIVSQPTLENLELVPGIWRVTAVSADSTLFALLIATLLAVPAARFTSAFGGLAVGQMVLVVGWFAGYVTFGMAAVSLFVALFIGLNLAANIDYAAGGMRR